MARRPERFSRWQGFSVMALALELFHAEVLSKQDCGVRKRTLDRVATALELVLDNVDRGQTICKKPNLVTP